MSAFCEVRRLLPREDIIYLADRDNAPYGTKTEEELKKLVANDVKRLRELGADMILIACCTASSIYGELDERDKRMTLPIITPAAKVATTLGKRIAVIATERTVTSHAFKREIQLLDEDSSVFEFAEQKLVHLIESGSRDGKISSECEDELHKIKEEVLNTHAEVLVLGCTHFPHVAKEIQRLLPHIKTVNPAKEGAIELLRVIKNKKLSPGNGKTVYT